MRTIPAAALLISVALPASAEDAHQHDAHVHGTGALDIAIEGNLVAMELRAPGADIVGFEHAAHSEEDEAAISEALEKLSGGDAVFAFSQAAGCMLSAASVELHGEEHEDEHAEHDDHDDHKDEHAEHDDHDDHKDEHAEHHDHDDHEEADGAAHSEFHAEYSFECETPDALESIELRYFDLFDGAKELEVQFISGKGSFGAEVTRDAPVLDLKGRI